MLSEIKHMTVNDYDRVMEFIKIVFPDAVSILERVIFGSPFRRPDNFAYIEEDGRIISFVGLFPHRVRLGDSEVRAGEIEAVGTHPKFRGRGLASQLMEYWIQYMKEEGIALSWLYGIPNFYQQFGFEYALPFHKYTYTTIAPGQLTDLQPTHQVRAMEQKDLGAVSSIYDFCNRHISGSAIRSLGYWEHRFQTTTFGPHRWIVVSDGGAVIGYLWLTESDGELTVRESGAINEAACQSMASYLFELSKAHPQVREIGVMGPHISPLARYLYRWGARRACTNEIYPGTWGGMVRIIDLANTLDALSATMSRRLAASPLSNHSGCYTITSEVGSAGLEIRQGQVRVVPVSDKAQGIWIPGPVLTQMIMGYKGLEDRADVVRPQDETLVQLLSILFPPDHPWVWDLELSEELLSV